MLDFKVHVEWISMTYLTGLRASDTGSQGRSAAAAAAAAEWAGPLCRFRHRGETFARLSFSSCRGR